MGRLIALQVLLLIGLETLVYSRPSKTETPQHLIGQKDLIEETLGHVDGKLNVSNRRGMRLFSPKSSMYLQVRPKVVNAKGDSDSKYIDLIVESVGFDLVRIRGKETNNYVCFDHRSTKLKARKDGESVDCIFKESVGIKTGRTIFTSFSNANWSIGIKNNGKVRPGNMQKVKKSKQNNTYEFTTILRSRRR